jgi:hypothetical protein
MSFGLTNTPTVFMDMMNRVFHDYLDQFTLVFIDNILIYSKTLEEHLWKELKRLRREKLYAKLKKCKLWLDSVSFLGHLISKEGVAVEPKKVKAVVKWTRPINIFKIKSFLGLTSYYRRFIEGFSKLLGPLTALMKKNARYVWTNECEKSFQELKRRLITAPMLALPIGFGNFIVYSDASKKGLGCVIMQNGNVFAYTSCQLKAYYCANLFNSQVHKSFIV